MKLSPVEQEKLLLHVAGELAIKRKERGVKLNYPEAMAYLSHFIMEGARDGKTVAQHVGVDLDLMDSDTKKMRGGRPYIFSDVRTQKNVDKIVGWIQHHMLLEGVNPAGDNA